MYLWDKVRALSHMTDGPWFIGGDFNSSMDAEEKSGGCLSGLVKVLILFPVWMIVECRLWFHR